MKIQFKVGATRMIKKTRDGTLKKILTSPRFKRKLKEIGND
jgi:hypothetical protein